MEYSCLDSEPGWNLCQGAHFPREILQLQSARTILSILLKPLICVWYRVGQPSTSVTGLFGVHTSSLLRAGRQWQSQSCLNGTDAQIPCCITGLAPSRLAPAGHGSRRRKYLTSAGSGESWPRSLRCCDHGESWRNLPSWKPKSAVDARMTGVAFNRNHVQ